MSEALAIAPDVVPPPGTIVEAGVTIGERVLLAGPGIVLRTGARIDAGAVIAEGAVVGQGAWIRTGAVVLGSVPANAVVEGNPARVVGYRAGISASGGRAAPRVVDPSGFQAKSRPAILPLDVAGSALYLMRRVTDARGSLTVGEVPSDLPFTPARYFAVFDVPSRELRGEHAHRVCRQFLICLHGSCQVLLDDGLDRCEVTLDRPDVGVFMPPMIWGTQYRYSGDAVLLVFASHAYDPEDYLRTYEDFLAARRLTS